MGLFDMFKKKKYEVQKQEEDKKIKKIDSDDEKIKKCSSPNYIIKDNYKSMKKCPVCNNDTFDERNFDYEICKECFWEYDPIQIENPNYFGGANHLSLNEYKKLYEQLKKQYWDFSCKDGFYKNLILKLEEERSRQYYSKLESSIMNYLIEQGDNEQKQHDNEKTFASFKVYLIEEKDKTCNVYTWTLSGNYYLENGEIKNSSVYSIPYKFVVENNNDEFVVTNSQKPRDGSYYSIDMKNIFPSNVRENIENANTDRTIEKLQLEIDEQTKLYFHK